MRKLVIAIFTALLCVGMSTSNVQAQGFDAKKVYVDLGVGVPRYSVGAPWFYAGGYNYYRMPTFKLSVRYGFNDFISGGLYSGYTHYGWKQTTSQGFEYNEQYSYIPVGVGASFHVWSFLNKTLDLGLGVDELDLYATLMTGAEIRIHSDKTPTKYTKTNSVNPFFGSMIGARYFFLNNMGAFVEFGYGMNSYFTAGLTFKF